VGKFFLGALIGSGLTGGLGAWLAGQVPVVPPHMIENGELARELTRAHRELRSVEAEREMDTSVVRSTFDVRRGRWK
jgi:hypothetical protein